MQERRSSEEVPRRDFPEALTSPGFRMRRRGLQRIAEAVFAALVDLLPDIVTVAPAGSSGNFAPGGYDLKDRSSSCTKSAAAAMAASRIKMS